MRNKFIRFVNDGRKNSLRMFQCDTQLLRAKILTKQINHNCYGYVKNMLVNQQLNIKFLLN